MVRYVKRLVGRILSRQCIFVMGCQRSGTTLVFMMLTSHPDVVGRNEDEAGHKLPRLRELVSNTLARKRTCYKAIVHVGQLKEIQQRFPYAKLVWIVRHPYAVISSMRELQMSRTQNWLEQQSAKELGDLANLFAEIHRLNMNALSPVSRGSYVWKYKMMAIPRYRTSGFTQVVIRFEDLVSDPKRTFGDVLSRLGLRWNDAVLEHQRHHAHKRYIGNNWGNRPIDVDVLKKDDGLDDGDRATISSICRLEMKECDYA